MLTFIHPRLGLDLAVGAGLKIAGATASFALSWLMARHFGADDLGLFQLALVSATFASVVALSGFDVFLVREIRGTISGKNRTHASKLYGRCLRNVLVFSITLLGVFVACAESLTLFVGADTSLTMLLYLFSPLILLLPIIRLSIAMLRMSRKIVLSQLLDGFLYTGFAATILAILIFTGFASDAAIPAILYVSGAVLASLIAFVSCRKIIGAFGGFSHPVPTQFSGFVFAAPMLIVTANDWILLSLVTLFEGASGAGVYRIAFQVASLVMLINSSFITMSGPWLSKAAGEGDIGEVAILAQKIGLIGLGVVLPFGVFASFQAELVLGFFGPDFVRGAETFQVLMIAQFVNIAFGPVGVGMVMIGKERISLAVEVCATATGFAVALASLPQIGMVGAAYGVLTAAVLRNAACAFALHRAAALQRKAKADPEGNTA